MVLSLYKLHAPRRNIDYSLMKISNNMNDDEFNYLDIDKKNNSFLITKLKNKTYNIHFLKTFYNEDIIKSQDMTRI